MKTIAHIIMFFSVTASLISCGNSERQTAEGNTSSASSNTLRDTCVTFIADGSSTFGKWLSDKLLVHPFTDADFGTASGEYLDHFNISFIIGENGDMTNIYIKGTDSTDTSGYSNVQKYLISLLEDAPTWSPAIVGGYKVSTPMSIDVLIMPYVKAKEIIYERQSKNGRQIPYVEGQNYVKVGSIFRHGTSNNIMDWLANNIKYPEEAKNQKLEGRVTVYGKVDTLGCWRDLGIFKAPGTTDNEILKETALKTIASMPPQDPYYENGHPIEIAVALPVVFKAE